VHLLAAAGDTVHVIGERWHGAPRELETSHNGRLIVHRVPAQQPHRFRERATTEDELSILATGFLPTQGFSWNAALVAETLMATGEIDLVEGQEWEAPLFHLLQRRASGTANATRCPIVVHLHSPTAMIWEHNEWNQDTGYARAVTRQEAYCVAKADALLCPSAFLADRCAAHFGIDRQAILTIPYPMGPLPDDLPPREVRQAPREIVHLGRVELRKGVLEFVRAAIAVAQRTPDVEFSFVGADTPHRGTQGVTAFLQQLIPDEYRARFHFRGVLPRAQALAALRRAWCSVVPSRWENFPNTCLESMAMAVPVLASPNGGMREVIEDGRSGWIADGQDPDALAVALERALATGPAALADMGRAATRRVHDICNADRVIALQREARRVMVATGATTSLAPDAHRFPRAWVQPAAVAEEKRVRGQLRRTRRHAPDEFTNISMAELLRLPWRDKGRLLARAASEPGRVAGWILHRFFGV
jgi:glycosyltransferase involved in cell wall biosynthesis